MEQRPGIRGFLSAFSVAGHLLGASENCGVADGDCETVCAHPFATAIGDRRGSILRPAFRFVLLPEVAKAFAQRMIVTGQLPCISSSSRVSTRAGYDKTRREVGPVAISWASR